MYIVVAKDKKAPKKDKKVGNVGDGEGVNKLISSVGGAKFPHS